MDEFLAKLQSAVQKLVTLDIITVVGSVSYPPAEPPVPVANAKMIRTRIDLFQGDITTEIDPAFISGDMAPLREYHTQREQQGATIVKQNIEAVEKLFDLVVKMVRTMPPSAQPGQSGQPALPAKAATTTKQGP